MAVHHIDVTHEPTPVPQGIAAADSAVWVETRPHLKRSAAIASDILAAYGKRRDVAGRGRNQHADLTLALAWLHAYRATSLVLTEAQRMTPLLLRQTISLARAAQLPLWLLHRTPRNDAFLLGLDRYQAHPMKLRDVPSPATIEVPRPSRPTLGLEVPPAAFHTFLTRARAALPATAYARLRRHHIEAALAFSDILDDVGTNPDSVARIVGKVLLPAPEDDQLIVEVRALQLACWHHDAYLKADVPRLLVSPERQTVDAATVDLLLTAYRQPHRALVVALAMNQVGVTETTLLRLRDADPAGALTTRSGRRIVLLEHATAALRAQVFLRRQARARPGDSLLTVPERAMSTALNEANVDLDVRVHGRRAERYQHPRRWLTSLGLTLHELA